MRATVNGFEIPRELNERLKNDAAALRMTKIELVILLLTDGLDFLQELGLQRAHSTHESFIQRYTFAKSRRRQHIRQVPWNGTSA